MQTRAHLETQMASALALKSPNEYRQWLLSYIRFLARWLTSNTSLICFIIYFCCLNLFSNIFWGFFACSFRSTKFWFYQKSLDITGTPKIEADTDMWYMSCFYQKKKKRKRLTWIYELNNFSVLEFKFFGHQNRCMMCLIWEVYYACPSLLFG